MLTVSKYLTLSDTTFVDASGTALQPAYLATTGHVYMLSQDVADALSEDACDEPLSPELADELSDAGILVDSEVDELANIVDDNRNAIAQHRVRTFVIMPTSYCNLGCSYCGQLHTKTPLKSSHRSNLKDRITRESASGNYDDLEIKWFGGEPLMGYANILDISRDAIAAADQHSLTYTANMVTNGVLLDERKLDALYHQCRIKNFEITLDGISHDLLRPRKGGGTSRDKIASFISAAVRQPDYPELRISIRTNVSPANRHEASDFASTMAEKGLAHEKVSFYAAPIHSWGNDVGSLDLGKTAYGDVEVEWIQAYLKAGLNCKALVPMRRKKMVCIAVTSAAEVVTAAGDVFSCTEQPLVPGYENTKVGSISGLRIGRRPEGQYDLWNDRVGAHEYPCASCKIFPICGGACPKAWTEGNPPCPATKFNLTRKLDLYAETKGFSRAS